MLPFYEVTNVLLNAKGDVNFKFHILKDVLSLSMFFFAMVKKTISEFKRPDIKFVKLRQVEELSTKSITFKFLANFPPQMFYYDIKLVLLNRLSFLHRT